MLLKARPHRQAHTCIAAELFQRDRAYRASTAHALKVDVTSSVT